jgi:hypothetical protein
MARRVNRVLKYKQKRSFIPSFTLFATWLLQYFNMTRSVSSEMEYSKFFGILNLVFDILLGSRFWVLSILFWY